jgi:hypothetical protein
LCELGRSDQVTRPGDSVGRSDGVGDERDPSKDLAVAVDDRGIDARPVTRDPRQLLEASDKCDPAVSRAEREFYLLACR